MFTVSRNPPTRKNFSKDLAAKNLNRLDAAECELARWRK